jgi:hypothetical protein
MARVRYCPALQNIKNQRQHVRRQLPSPTHFHESEKILTNRVHASYPFLEWAL